MSEARITDLSLLHPAFLPRLHELIAAVEREGLPLRVYETVRTPWRQAELLKRKPPATRAKPWTSAHQYGLAVDMVFHRGDGPTRDVKWTWEEPEVGAWARYGELASECGLSQLSFERPHVQLPGWQDIGEICPWTAGQMEAWSRAGLEMPE